jgi:hypothetical protein
LIAGHVGSDGRLVVVGRLVMNRLGFICIFCIGGLGSGHTRRHGL